MMWANLRGLGEKGSVLIVLHNINIKTMIIVYVNQGGLPERVGPLAKFSTPVRFFLLRPLVGSTKHTLVSVSGQQ